MVVYLEEANNVYFELWSPFHYGAYFVDGKLLHTESFSQRSHTIKFHTDLNAGKHHFRALWQYTRSYDIVIHK